jgi:predicted Holliday junction resolvase-like endonuclease
MDDLQIELLNSQLNRLKDSIESRFQKVEANLKNRAELETEKLNQVKTDILSTKKAVEDHENRIRIVDDSVISNKTTTTLIQAGQAALTLIAAAIAAWLGSR